MPQNLSYGKYRTNSQTITKVLCDTANGLWKGSSLGIPAAPVSGRRSVSRKQLLPRQRGPLLNAAMIIWAKHGTPTAMEMLADARRDRHLQAGLRKAQERRAVQAQ